MSVIPHYRPEEIIQGSHSFAVDASTLNLRVCDGFDETSALATAEFFQRSLEAIRNGQVPVEEEKLKRIQASQVFLRAMGARYQEGLNLGLAKCKSDPFLMTLSKLDRFITAEKYPVLEADGPIAPERIRDLYTLTLTKEVMDKWLSEKLHRGHCKEKRGDTVASGDKLSSSPYAAEGFLHHPEEVDFLMQSYTHKQMARLNDSIVVDPHTKHHRILHHGQLEDVSSLAQRYTIQEGKLKAEDGTRSYYCHNRGITQYDPEKWQDLPVYRQRRHAQSDEDYRLVIKTVLSDHDDKHSWIELKDGSNVYNVGYFWNEEDSLSVSAHSIRGALHSPDKNELIGKEGCVHKTICKISKEQFQRLKQEIETFQNRPQQKIFNLLSSNCTSWTRRILSKIGIDLPSKASLSHYVIDMLPVPNSIKRMISPKLIFRGVFLLETIERVIRSIFVVIRNFFIYCLGGANTNDILKTLPYDPEDLVFRNFFDIFNVRKGFYDHPRKVREWQERVDEDRQKRIDTLRNSQEYQSLTDAEKAQKEDQIRFDIPFAIANTEMDFTL